MKIFTNFDEFAHGHPIQAQETVTRIGSGKWQEEEIIYHPNLASFAQYQVLDGLYSSMFSAFDIKGAPNLLNYIDYESLGNELSDTWNAEFYLLLRDGSIVHTKYGW